MPPLDVVKTLDEIRSMYKQSARTMSFNALVYGGMGSGKTHLLLTARRPILHISFDPGGSKTLRDEIEQGWIISDTRFEEEDPKKPKVAELWDKEYEKWKLGGLFNSIGTLAVDSGTTWASAIMNLTLKRAGRTAGTPQQNDYLPTMSVMENMVKDMCTLPCDFVFICHEDMDKDEASGKMYIGPLLIGKLRYRIPLLFDEIYSAQAKQASGGEVKYSLLTRNSGLYTARTRLGKGGLFETYEEQDIKKLLKKAGYSTDDKVLAA